jgi:uncharacterized protein
MMSIKSDLIDALHKAIKTKDVNSKTAIRLALSSIKRAEVDNGEELDDLLIFGILQKEIKTREETIAEAEKAGRHEMIQTMNKEIAIVQKFLPAELDDLELIKIIDNVITEKNATSIKQMGSVMKIVIEKVQGKASNDRISKIVKSKLTA